MARPVTFTRAAARRISAAVRKIEQQPRQPAAARRRHHRPLPPGAQLAKLTSTLYAGSSATATIWSGTPGAETASARADITVWDWLLSGSGSNIASGRKIIVMKINRAWYVIAASCA